MYDPTRTYMEQRPYGKPEGLADRLDAAAQRLSHDRIMPWLGLGLHEDLRAAAALLRGQPVPAKSPEPEYDL